MTLRADKEKNKGKRCSSGRKELGFYTTSMGGEGV